MCTLHERLQKQLEAPNLGTADCLMRIAGGLVLTAMAVDGSIGAWGFLGLLLLRQAFSGTTPVREPVQLPKKLPSPVSVRVPRHWAA